MQHVPKVELLATRHSLGYLCNKEKGDGTLSNVLRWFGYPLQLESWIWMNSGFKAIEPTTNFQVCTVTFGVVNVRLSKFQFGLPYTVAPLFTLL